MAKRFAIFTFAEAGKFHKEKKEVNGNMLRIRSVYQNSLGSLIFWIRVARYAFNGQFTASRSRVELKFYEFSLMLLSKFLSTMSTFYRLWSILSFQFELVIQP